MQLGRLWLQSSGEMPARSTWLLWHQHSPGGAHICPAPGMALHQHSSRVPACGAAWSGQRCQCPPCTFCQSRPNAGGVSVSSKREPGLHQRGEERHHQELWFLLRAPSALGIRLDINPGLSSAFLVHACYHIRSVL